MRATRNWGVIRTGATFENLATTLVFFEDPGARLFGRRGRDGGQDARSGDGKTVYQAKHHEAPTTAKAIADARNEATKIAEYRKTDHARYAQWLGVTSWVLVTNASFNPTDEQTWQTEVLPLFTSLGLTATYWEQATLDGYLDKHPEVGRAFFENENRVFLSPAEACLRVADDDPFTQRDDLAPYVGRESDLAALDTFLASTKSYLQVHAEGGIGKTRFILEGACRIAARGEWQVLWANVHSMEGSSAWLDAVVPERPTLLVVDEPGDERLIHLFKEQLGRRVGRAQQWKIVIAVRSSNDPVLRALRHHEMKRWVDERLLTPLTTPECEEMCRGLLDTGKLADSPEGWREQTAKMLARRFDGYPIWLTLAVHLLEEDGSLAKLPNNARELCRVYLNEVLRVGQTDEKPLQLARWVALLGPINREDDGQLQHLADRAGYTDLDQLRRSLRQLVEARLLRKWGARDRLVDMKPDVLRDFVVRDWLCEERDYGEQRIVPSKAAEMLVSELTGSLMKDRANQREERILAALARTDFLLRHGDNPPRLGAPLYAAVDDALTGMSPSQRISTVENLSKVGAYYPEDTLRLLRRLRLEPATEETVNGIRKPYIYSQNQVVLALSRAFQSVSQGHLTDAQRATIMEELYALVIEEQHVAPTLKYGLPNDGNRADGVIRSLLENGPGHVHEFGDVAASVVLRRLKLSALLALGSEDLKALQAVVKPLCNVQRHQSWFDGSTIHMGNQLLHEKHPNRIGSAKVLARVKAILESEFAPLHDELKTTLWDVLSEAHREANYAQGHLVGEQQNYADELNKWLLENLVWLKKVLSQRALSPGELRAARKLWHWHAEFGKGDCGAVARELEETYLSHPVVQLFENLINWDEIHDTQVRIDLKGKELAKGGTAEIESFLASAEDFLGREDLRRVHSIAYSLGCSAMANVPVRRFLVRGLRNCERTSARFQFVMSGLRSWIFTQRKADAARAAKLVDELLNLCCEGKRLDLLRMLYGPHRVLSPELLASAGESALVQNHLAFFVEQGAVPDFIGCSLWGMRHDWQGLKICLGEAMASLKGEQRTSAMKVLVEELHTVLDHNGEWCPPSDLLRWFWDQVTATPDLQKVDYNHGWSVDQIVKKLGKVPVSWLPDALQLRASLHDGGNNSGFDPPNRLLRMVELLGRENVGDPETQDAVASLCSLLTQSYLMNVWIPKLLARLDPQGFEVPRRVARMAQQQPTTRSMRAIAQVACCYKVGTPGWRTIARSVLQETMDFAKEKREQMYSLVSETGSFSWTSEAGKVPKIFIDAVEAASQGLAAEVEAIFVPFWEWRVQKAERELREQQEKLKEEVWD